MNTNDPTLQSRGTVLGEVVEVEILPDEHVKDRNVAYLQQSRPSNHIQEPARWRSDRPQHPRGRTPAYGGKATAVQRKTDRSAHPWITIRHRHVTDTQSVERLSTIVTNVAQYNSFSIIEADVEGPLLPFDHSAFEGELTESAVHTVIVLAY